MSWTDMMNEFISVAWEAAQSAGDSIRANWHQPKSIEYKAAIDLVTSVDREAEQRIVKILRKHFPRHSIVAEEETTFIGSDKNYRWIIDPLDGTTNFAHTYPHVSISIALEHDGEIIVALVYDPLRQECFRAIKNHGASLNDQPIYSSKINELDKALLATGFPYDRRENADFYVSLFKAFMTPSQGIRRDGSAALDLCYVACGRVDGFWELKLRPWDVAAGALIVREAGGTVSDFSGNEFSIWGEETLASNGLIHSQMLQIASRFRQNTNR